MIASMKLEFSKYSDKMLDNQLDYFRKIFYTYTSQQNSTWRTLMLLEAEKRKREIK